MDDLKKAVNAPERLIDANELMEWLKSKIRECVVLNAHAEAATTEEIIRYVKHMPAVDAVPVVHARWRALEDGSLECTNCRRICPHDFYCYGNIIRNYKGNYCQNCGAKMDVTTEPGT